MILMTEQVIKSKAVSSDWHLCLFLLIMCWMFKIIRQYNASGGYDYILEMKPGVTPGSFFDILVVDLSDTTKRLLQHMITFLCSAFYISR